MCRKRSATSVVLSSAMLVVVAACDSGRVPTTVDAPRAVAQDAVAELRTREGKDKPSVNCDPDNGGLTLPPGFCALVVARDIGPARHLAVRANGDLYVAIDDRPGAPAGILALRDTDGDGRADVQTRFGAVRGNGIDIRGDALFFATNDRVVRFELEPGVLVPVSAPLTLVSGLVTTGDHARKAVKLSRDGTTMFVNIGSASNSCQVANRILQSPGIDPCPELAVRAGVWQFSTTQAGQTLSSGRRYGTELRNMNALAVNREDGALYGAQNGRDQLLDNWPQLFSARDDALLPGEELVRIQPGVNYGWPYCFWDGRRQKKVLAPEYGGNGRLERRCAARAEPLAAYPAHWAPLGMTFYGASQFPQRFQGGLFIAMHGSRFDAALQPAGAGYNVIYQPWRAGRPAGRWREFASGFAAGSFSPTGAAHRPVDVAVAPDGSLYISDDKAGFIWRVQYVDR